MLSTTYLILKKRLTEEVPELKEIAWFQGQGDGINDGQIKAAPAAYIRFEPTDVSASDISDQQEGIQKADLEFDIILLSDNTFEDDRRAGKDDAVDHFLLLDKINKALSGFNGDLIFLEPSTPEEDNCHFVNTIRRIGIDPAHELRALMKTTQTFVTVAYDFSAAVNYTPIPAGQVKLIIESLEVQC